jgi:uncharacterized membrane protein
MAVLLARVTARQALFVGAVLLIAGFAYEFAASIYTMVEMWTPSVSSDTRLLISTSLVVAGLVVLIYGVIVYQITQKHKQEAEDRQYQLALEKLTTTSERIKHLIEAQTSKSSTSSKFEESMIRMIQHDTVQRAIMVIEEALKSESLPAGAKPFGVEMLRQLKYMASELT